MAEKTATWQSWRSWLGERSEDLRAPCQAACPVGTNAGLYVSSDRRGALRRGAARGVGAEPLPGDLRARLTAPCETVCRWGEFDAPIAIRDLKRFATDHGSPWKRAITQPKQRYQETVGIVGAGPTGLSAAITSRGVGTT